MLLRLQLGDCEKHFDRILKKPFGLRSTRYEMEGLLSRTWQAWCFFCRNVCIRSALGCTTASGGVHPASVLPVTSTRASHVAFRGANGLAPQPLVENNILRKEPTWGDVSKITKIIDALNPGNRLMLKSHFAGGLSGPVHCQIVRNACAHTNPQTLNEVRSLAVSYNATGINHPIESVLWKEKGTGTHAYLIWLDEMKIIAEGVVK